MSQNVSAYLRKTSTTVKVSITITTGKHQGLEILATLRDKGEGHYEGLMDVAMDDLEEICAGVLGGKMRNLASG